MASAKELLAKAVSQIGYKESPSGSNNTKYGKWYGLNYNPWCDMLVSWCADQIGAGNIIGKYVYCPSHVNYFKKKGWWLDREEKPQPGDIIFFSNGTRACHVGIVEKRNGTESVTTIEGNTSVTSNDNGGCVMRRVRKYGKVGSSWFILGFARPNYSGASGTVTSGSTSSSTSTNSGDIAVDGEIGHKTIKLLQKRMGTTVDGIISGQYTQYKKYWTSIVEGCSWSGGSSLVIKALQRKIGATADGILGQDTARKLQNYLISKGYSCGSCGADGIFGNDSAKALQRWLNDGAK